MLSYQHSYHAGNLADIHKHVILSIVLQAMALKGKPLSYFETHAGRGLYNLQSEEAQKTGEAKAGIIRCFGKFKKELPEPYVNAVEKVHKLIGKDFYAGSPLLSRIMLDDESNVFNLCELHPQEYAALHKIMYDFKNVHTHKRDGYEGVLALCPPRSPAPKRGLILIDPSFEIKEEYNKAADFILKIHKKWAEAVIMLWYPVLSSSNHTAMIEKIKTASLPKLTIQEIMFKSLPKAEGMLGDGLVIVNTPFAAEEQIKTFGDSFSNFG